MQKILLHSCCAPCSAPILEWLIQNGWEPVIFFFNPNIFPVAEYVKRKDECARYAFSLGVECIDGDYDHRSWLEKVAGLEHLPERSERCARCFSVRLEATALLSAEKRIPLFTTTLGGSRWKSLEQITAAGNRAASLTDGVRFWDKDWKKSGLTERRRDLLLRNGFYNQLYCGCEFSIRKNTQVPDPQNAR